MNVLCHEKIPAEYSRRLYAVADPSRTSLRIVKDAGHNCFFCNDDGLMAKETSAWLRRWLVTAGHASACLSGAGSLHCTT